MFEAAPKYPDVVLGLGPQHLPGCSGCQCLEMGRHSPNKITEGNTKFVAMWKASETQTIIRNFLEKSSMNKYAQTLPLTNAMASACGQ